MNRDGEERARDGERKRERMFPAVSPCLVLVFRGRYTKELSSEIRRERRTRGVGSMQTAGLFKSSFDATDCDVTFFLKRYKVQKKECETAASECSNLRI